MDFAEFMKKTAASILELKKMKTRKIILVHDDADGLCSGAVMKAALEREGYRVRALCLEKVYPQVIKGLHAAAGKIIVYFNIGSAHADFISEVNSSRNLTIILDHHDPMPSKDPMVHDLNLEHYGFQGETDFSGATCNYLFAKALNQNNFDLAYLALVGSQEIPNVYVSLNKIVFEEAETKRD